MYKDEELSKIQFLNFKLHLILAYKLRKTVVQISNQHHEPLRLLRE